ncbi:putative baseplate assembly protein [Duganella sp. BuS-21]|uniref:putative baseplate assembly protein n=1 Tax=Duganella sp. BuS-21 TaxID=2943848 RepID=UPI0035A5E8D2
MPLPKPTLDNRHYDQLVSEGRALIPRLAPRLTNQNASEPAIALLELGAWLAEQNIYRFDRLSDAALRSFVRLLGIEPRPPTVAQTVVEVGLAVPQPLLLPARVQLGDAATPAPTFETTTAAYVSPARLVSLAADDIAVDTANAALQPFAPFGVRPRAGHAVYLGFDAPLVAGGLADARWRLHIWTGNWRDDAAIGDALRAEQAVAAAPPNACPVPDWRLHYRVATVWEYFGAGQRWLPLANVDDQTRALTLSGDVVFDAPPQHLPRTAGEPYLIRCRIVRGRYEVPPVLLHIGWNAVAAEHAVSVAEKFVGRSRGHASAQFDLDCAPVVAGSVSLRLDDGAGNLQTGWREAVDFEQAGAFDLRYTLAPERGWLQSGDGRHGAILPAGYEIHAAFRSGGGVEGNLPAGSLLRAPSTDHNQALLPASGILAALRFSQPFAASGGAPREALSSAQGRAYAHAGAVDKAVTLADIERLALATPGVPVARVRAVAGLDPVFPCYPAAGVVTVIAIPSGAGAAPMPSRALLDAVGRYLHPRRLVTCELQVIAPHYRRVAVRAVLVAEGAASVAQTQALLRLARQRIDALFHPLHGGPDGNGWPFGRTVYRTELMALLTRLPGVAQVSDVGLIAGWPLAQGEPCGDGCGDSFSGCAGCGGSDCAGGRTGTAGCANIILCEHELVMPGRHQLQVRSQRPSNLTRSDIHECP